MAGKKVEPAPKAVNGGASSEFIGTAQAARELGVNPATIRRWGSDGRIEARKIGKQWRVRRSDLAKVIVVQDASTDGAAASLPSDAAEKCEQSMDALLRKAGFRKEDAAAQCREIESRIARTVKESDPSACRLMARILLHGVHSQASDMHLEPSSSALRVRQRIDGVLMEVDRWPPSVSRGVVDETKRWAGMNVAERRRPQDGRGVFTYRNREIDLRVSTMPALYGEVITLRLLDRNVVQLSLDRLGFEPDQLQRYRQIVRRPNGLIVVTAPTGSGKTSTVYATLSELNTSRVKIMTAEDPVEYVIEGLNQSPIDVALGFGFTQAARQMLRQAPNIMMIGEMRDLETAEILVQAALTGHLVFSTLHTDDALSAITRLFDIGIKPFLVSSSLQCILAQRLVRQVCAHCKSEYRPKDDELNPLQIEGDDRKRSFVYGKGCEKCHGTGYRGRMVIAELLELTRGVRTAVLTQDMEQITAAARASGWKSLREIGLQKIFRGETTLEEVARETCFADRAQMI